MNSGKNDELTLKQAKVVAALVAGQTWAQAARAAGVGETTIRRWLKLEHVRAALREQQAQAVDTAARVALSNVELAIWTMAQIMTNPDTPPATRLQAADKLQSAADRWITLSAFDERLRVLENRLS